MVNILGREYSKCDVIKYFGNYSNLFGTRRVILNEGRSRECEIIEVTVGNGMIFEVNLSRGMDIGMLKFNNIPISYHSYNGEVNPVYYENSPEGWLRNFSGGLLSTCGLTSIGPYEEGINCVFPMHGRISNIPAENIKIDNYFNDNVYSIKISGTVRECRALGYRFDLHRTIEVNSNCNKIFINDIIENLSFEDKEFMILYHFNIGHPILSKECKFFSHSNSVVPRDQYAIHTSEKYFEYLDPYMNYPDVVYFHDLEDINDLCTVALLNENINMGVALYFHKSQLDCFTQWKFTNMGDYVTGIEPGNALVNGRSHEIKNNRVKKINAFESKNIHLEFEILTNTGEINRYKNINNF